jgi:hypothetical protein
MSADAEDDVTENSDAYMIVDLPVMISASDLDKIAIDRGVGQGDATATASPTSKGGRLDRAFERAKTIIDLRKRREASLGAELFAEPAWDILLDLFVQRVEGRRTSSTSASIASRAPTTTALRYISALQERGLVTRNVADHDHRVHYVRLSDDAFDKMIALLSQDRQV